MLKIKYKLAILISLLFLCICEPTYSLPVNSSEIHGLYYGYYEIGVSGSYKRLLTGNYTDASAGLLRITYVYDVWLNILFNGDYKYIYAYKLVSYNIYYINLPLTIIKNINETLNSMVNKTIIGLGRVFNPSILINYNIDVGELYWINFSNYYNVSAITLYEDVVCFEYRAYIENIVNNNVYRAIRTFYYEAISRTPLYLYEYRGFFNSFNDQDYLYVKHEIRDDGIGYGFSKIVFSKTKFIYTEKGVGSLSIVSYGSMINPKIVYNNTILQITVEQSYPYMLVIQLDKGLRINNTNISFNEYTIRDEKLYISAVETSNSMYLIALNQNIERIVDQQGNFTYIRPITYEEKSYQSPQMIILTIVFNVFVILITYYISKGVAKIINEVV